MRAPRSLQSSLNQLLVNVGLTPILLSNGRNTSYHFGHTAPVRIDPKNDFLRIWIGEAEEAAAPARLRGSYVQKGWLIARPEDASLAEEYVLLCVRRKIGLA
jgi:hypothetical protein